MQNEVSVGRWVVLLGSGWSALRGFSGVKGWLDWSAEFSASYLVGIKMECVNWHLGSRDLTKCHS